MTRTSQLNVNLLFVSIVSNEMSSFLRPLLFILIFLLLKLLLSSPSISLSLRVPFSSPSPSLSLPSELRNQPKFQATSFYDASPETGFQRGAVLIVGISHYLSVPTPYPEAHTQKPQIRSISIRIGQYIITVFEELFVQRLRKEDL